MFHIYILPWRVTCPPQINYLFNIQAKGERKKAWNAKYFIFLFLHIFSHWLTQFPGEINNTKGLECLTCSCFVAHILLHRMNIFYYEASN